MAMDGLRLRLRQLPGVVRRGVRHPRWLAENVRLALDRRRETRRDFALADYDELIAEPAVAVAAVVGGSENDYHDAVTRRWPAGRDERDGQRIWDAREELLEIVGAVVALARPAVVVETGVARGYTTATILHALRDDPEARLYSIDLPPLEVDEAPFIGEVVPDELRAQWTLEVGPSRHLLPALARRVAPIDVFLHDADHTYASQLEEYRIVWPF